VEIFIERNIVSINHKDNYVNLLVFALFLVGLVVIFSYGVGNVSAASGDTIYVNSTGGHDTSDGSSWLNAKKSIKNATATVNSGGTVNIANGKYSGSDNTNITIDKGMNINGQSKTGTFLNGTNLSWIFSITSGNTVTITNLIFTNGYASGQGGAITNRGTLTVTNSTFTYNNAGGGGAIQNWYGDLTINRCNFFGNTADNGGAILNVAGSVYVTNSNFTGNSAHHGGGLNNGDILKVLTSTFTGNNATLEGGAIYTDDSSDPYYASLSVRYSTFTGNNAILEGGAIYRYKLSGSGTIADVELNRIVGNNATSGSAIYGPVIAENNWWGDNNGPTGKISGLTVINWFVLKIKAIPVSIQRTSFSKITADLTYENTGTQYSFGYLPEGIQIIFKTTIGTISNTTSTIYGIAQGILKSGTLGTATVSAKLDNQTMQTTVKIIDTIPPKVSTTTPINLKTGVSRTSTIAIKFSENIKSSIYFNNITIKNLTTGKTVTISKSISGTILNIKTTANRTANTWYTVAIPKAAIKDYAGNNLAANYTFKFKTGT